MVTQYTPVVDAAPQGAETYSSAMADAKNYIGWIIDSFRGHLKAPILEVGVGHGSYADVLCNYGDYIGVDIDPASVQEAKERRPGLDFRVSDIISPEFLALSREKGIRSIVCLNVLEHIETHDAAIANLARALPSGGHLMVIVPALQFLYNDLDRLAGHHRRYRRGEMRILMEKAGLTVDRCDYFNPVGGLGWLANRLVRHGSLNDNAVNSQITLFDRWLVPLSRLVDPVTRPFFGQSVIAIGSKR
jgi:SAM-dependent methyltransferase